MKAQLSILITNYNTSRFLNGLLNNIEKLTQNPYKVLINDNGSDSENLKELKKIEQQHQNVEVYYRNCPHTGSMAHGDAVNFLVSKVTTPYTAIFDSDCYPLMHGWDEYMICELNEKIKIIGSPLGESFCSAKRSDFPYQFLVLFDTKVYQELDIDARPRNREIGEDTCWQWYPKFTQAGYEGKIFRVENTRNYHKGPLQGVICVEYYIENEQLIASHFARGSQIGQKYRSKSLLGRILNRLFHFDKKKCLKEESIWKKLCEQICAQQTLVNVEE